MTTSLVATVIGRDRPGIVNEISDVARAFGANWAGSRMASLAGQFAGMVHFQVAAENADALASALRRLEASGLQVVIARSDEMAQETRRTIRLEVVGQDRPGIVRDVSAKLAQQGVSIHELETAVESAPMSGEQLFRMSAVLALPARTSDEDIKASLESVANEMMVDIVLGEDVQSYGPDE
ncbi:MAG TPA: ACT domain-containing protein [Casimicrobiaceae bacterium]|nr:ACT domain-containing protein [Casimicrobiaceae bacterium]